MSFFKKTNAKIFAKPSQKVTPDAAYWRKLSVPVLLKEFGAIDYIDFSPDEPYCFAVTCSAKVQIYNPITKQVEKTLSRFKENAYGGVFRSDGALLAAGSEDGFVRTFLVESKSLLRTFKGHSGPVHKCFFTCDKHQIASFSDDKTVKLWDIASGASVSEFSDHQDYVRAGAMSPRSPNIILSGSYDKKIRMFDSRTGTGPTFTVDHGYPVESVIFLPTSGIFISAGGTEVRVWDALAGGRLLARLCHHHKTVTCLGLASSNTRLLSGSLDRHIKIYDVGTYKPVHNLDFPTSILSLGVSNDNQTLAVGSVDGIVSVQRREEKEEITAGKARRRVSYRYYSDKRKPPHTDTVVPIEGKQLQSKHDAYLRKFQYSKALDLVLTPFTSNKNPHVTVAVLQELIRRKGLKNALESRPDKSIALLLRFLLKHIGEYRYTGTLIDVSNILLDVYEYRVENAPEDILDLMKKLRSRVDEEERLTLELLSLGGTISMLLAASEPLLQPIAQPV